MDIQALCTALKTKYPQSGLSDNEIQGLASCLFATGLVTDENVTTIVDAQADTIKLMQGLFDSRFAAQKNALTQSLTGSLKASLQGDFEKQFKEKYHIGDDGKQQQPSQQDEDLDTKLSRLLDAKLKPFTDKMTEEEERRGQEQRTALILEKAKANGINEELARMLNVPGDVTDLDSFMKDKAQKLANLGFQPSVPPSAGGPNKNDGEAIAAIIKEGGKQTS